MFLLSTFPVRNSPASDPGPDSRTSFISPLILTRRERAATKQASDLRRAHTGHWSPHRVSGGKVVTIVCCTGGLTAPDANWINACAWFYNFHFLFVAKSKKIENCTVV